LQRVDLHPSTSSVVLQALGDEYVPPVGLPEWKQPSFDDDDHVDPEKYQNAAPQVHNMRIITSIYVLEYNSAKNMLLDNKLKSISERLVEADRGAK